MIRSILLCAATAATALACGDDATTGGGEGASSQTATGQGSGSPSTGATASTSAQSTSTSTSQGGGAEGGAGPTSGLDFPSNGDEPADAFVAFQFLAPGTLGMPIWGPNDQGATYMWKYRPRQQTGYYVTFWWSNNGNFLWDGGSPNSYIGGHPYPTVGNSTGTDHNWEIATDYGGDYMTTRAGGPKPVVKDVWYTQALRATKNPDGTKTITFYTELPSVADEDVIEVSVVAAYGETVPPAPAITFGDSPWYADFQHERLSGVVRGIKIFDKVLTEADTLAEAADDAIVTAEGASHIWYMNINPRPDDISDKSGKGHHPAWAEPGNIAALWTP
jgi:hypothetical protein